MSGLEASLVLIGVLLGVMAILAAGAWFMLMLMIRRENRRWAAELPPSHA
jgi:hypothetical protein